MSRSQPRYLPTHEAGVRSNGFDTALVPVTARSIPLRSRENDPNVDRGRPSIPVSALSRSQPPSFPMTARTTPRRSRENDSNVDGGRLRTQAPTPMNLEVVKNTTINVLQQIQLKLSKCRLTKAQEGTREQIFSDLDRVGHVLLTVLGAHHEAASGIQHIIDNPPRRPTFRTVEGHLTSAWSSIGVASDEFNALKKSILKQSKLLKEGADISPGFFRRQAHKAVNHDLPGKSTFPSLCVGLASIVVNSAAAAEIAKRLPSAVFATNSLAVLAVAFGGAMQFAKYIGGDAAIYEPTARETTKKALDCIDQHLLQFCGALSSLQLYWKDVYSSQVKGPRVNADPYELLRILQLLEKHVDDCLVVITAIQNLSGSMIVIPTQLDIYGDRNRKAHGLPSGRH